MFFSIRRTAAAAAVALALTSSAFACTTILVGPEASADGSMLIARSADSNAMKAQHFVVHPAAKNQKGMYRTKDHNGANAFEYPLAKNALAYTTVPNWKTQVHGAVGWNSAGVGVSGTESIYAKDELLKLDPYIEDTGITEDDVHEVVLPRARTAREGVLILGKIVETIGAGEGFGVAFIDKNEIWYLETGTGHQWIAQRLPRNVYFASANQGRLQDFKAGDPNFLSSPTLVSWAEKNGFYSAKDGAFNFSRVYTRDDGRDRAYNDPRVWQIQKTLTPSLKQDARDGRSFPVFAKPEKPVTVSDLMRLMGDFYAGTDHDPYTKGLRGDEPYRPISVFRTYESHVMQVRPNLPKEIGEVTYLAMGMSALGIYVPFYQGYRQIPAEYRLGTDKVDSKSAYWRFRKLQTLAMTDFEKLSPVVRKAFNAYEAECRDKMAAFEANYVKTRAKNARKADADLQKFNTALVQRAFQVAEQVENELFTIRTKDIQDKVFFKNNKQLD